VASDEYWSIDVPGLSETGANELARVANGLEGVIGAVLIDPAVWFTMHFERETAAFMVKALESLGLTTEDETERFEAEQMAYELRSWLSETG
jgi:hypothetical protein